MNEKLVELLTLAHKVVLFRAGPGQSFWITFIDSYGEHTLADDDLNSLLERAACIAKISERSTERYANAMAS